jgi:hypothetical protein
VYCKGSRLVCTGGSPIFTHVLPVRTTFSDYLKTQSNLHWCFVNMQIKDDGIGVVEVIQTGATASVFTVSDGSYKNTYGAAAWTIGTEERDGLLAGKVICPGGPDDQSSYRSELTGLYAMMTVVFHLCQFYHITEGQVEICCDGASALTTAFDKGPFLSHYIPDYDLIGAIYALRKSSTIQWSHRHVKGHQDNYSSDLDIWAQCNVDMDAKAKSFLATTQRSARHYDVEGEPWQVWLQDSKITNNMQAKIYSWVQQEDSLKYWESKQDTADSVKHVDWSAIGSTMKQLPRSRRVFMSKHVAGMC